MEQLQELEALLARLEGATRDHGVVDDAIDAALLSPARVTAVRRLRDDAVMQRFRSELAAGRMEIATVKSFLDLLSGVLGVVLTRRG